MNEELDKLKEDLEKKINEAHRDLLIAIFVISVSVMVSIIASHLILN